MAIKAFDNPVVTKELRSRMRGSRAYWVLFIYLSILAVTLFLSYLSWWNSHNANAMSGGSAVSFTAGRTFFMTLFAVQAVLISLIMPALTSGAISIEREQRTFELLRSTTLSTRSIVLGKLFSSLSFVCLLLTASLPLISICFLLGGVSPQQVGVTYLLLLLNAVVYGAVALAWSAGTGSTATATAMSYGSLFLYFCVTAPFAIVAVMRGAMRGGQQLSLSALNPVGSIVGADTEMYYRWPMPAWVPALLINGLLIVLMLVLAGSRLSDNPRRRTPLVRGSLFLFLGSTLFFLDGSPILSFTPSYAALTLTLAGLIALMLFVPPFVTGELRDQYEAAVVEEPYWRRALFGHDLTAGVATALALVAVIGAVTAFAFSTWRATFSVTSLSTDVVIGATIMYASIALALAGFGKLLSVALRNRWAAMMMLYLLAALAMILPYMTYSAQQSASYGQSYGETPASAPFSDNLLYFCPLISLQQLCFDKGNGFSLLQAQSHLLFNSTLPDFVVCSALYLSIGLLSFVIARVIEKRRASAPLRVKTAAAKG